LPFTSKAVGSNLSAISYLGSNTSAISYLAIVDGSGYEIDLSENFSM
jgi:hypothetical protein